MENYYNLFGVDKNVSKEVLDAVYKNLIKTATEAERSKLNYAYGILSNPTKRAEYDAKLKNEHTTQSRPQQYHQPQEYQTVPQKKKGGWLKYTIIALIIVILFFIFKNCSNKNNNYSSDSISEDMNDSNLNTNKYNNDNLDDIKTDNSNPNTNKYNDDSLNDIKTNNSDESYNEDIDPHSIYSATEFSDGIAFVKITDSETFSHPIFAINASGEVLFEIVGCENPEDISIFKNGIFAYDNKVYNSNGEIIASPEKMGYDKICECDIDGVKEGYEMLIRAECMKPLNINGYVIVSKFEETYKDTNTYYGVINNKGEWVVMLSEAGEWINEDTTYAWNDGVLSAETYQSYYMNNDYYTNISQDEIGIVKQSYMLDCFENQNAGAEPTYEMILKGFNAEYIFEDAFLGWNQNEIINENAYDNRSKYKYGLYDYSGNLLIDLNEYSINISKERGDPMYKDGYLTYCANNGVSDYLFMINVNTGKTVFEPFKLDSWTENFYVTNSGVLVYNFSENHYGTIRGRDFKLYKTDGTIISYGQDITTINDFHDGIALSYSNNSTLKYVDNNGKTLTIKK